MRIQSVRLDDFRRFAALEVSGIPATARLIILAGPNGSGKSSLFDAFNVWYQMNAGLGWSGVPGYYSRTLRGGNPSERVKLVMHNDEDPAVKGSFYFRSAYRNDPEFRLDSLSRVNATADDVRFRRMIESDVAVSQNYQRLASQALEDLFEKESGETTVDQFRERIVGEIRTATLNLFPHLHLDSLGNPLQQGTFRFTKGGVKGFEYMNLSGGEKAAFDLILDLIVKRPAYSNAVFCIDEPDAHLNSNVQGTLLAELFRLIPESGQLWVATHSVGMMRKARDLSATHPGSVAFLDFGDKDFDKPIVMAPVRPTRQFWEGVLKVALDDLAHLVAPKEVVVCEGNPAGAIPGKNAEHDATIYDTIFGDEFPDVKFIAGGNNKDVASDRLGFVVALPKIASGIAVKRLIDRDDHAPADISEFAKKKITALNRRHLEAYLYDDEVLTALCVEEGKASEIAALLIEKVQVLGASHARGNPADDVKSASGELYNKIKTRLALTAVGDDAKAFARNKLAPLIRPGMAVYEELKRDIFGT